MNYWKRLLDCMSFWQFDFIARILVLFVVVFLVKLIDSQKKLKPIVLTVILSVCLLFPTRYVIKDGGSKMYWAPLYEIIVWNQMDDKDELGNIVPGRHDMEFFVFPFNTRWFGE